MKKSIIISIVIALFSVVGANAQMDRYEVQVDGLGCPFCAYGLEKKFKEFKGIKKVAIDIETGDFSFEYPSNKALTMEQVEKQVEKAGYTPITSKITRADGTVESSESKENMAINSADLTTGTAYVAGKCGMCEARIVKAATDVPGVASASWDQDTKLLEVEYSPGQTSVKEVEQRVAKVGHDTKNFQASAAAYKALPGCCKYERIEQ